MRRYRGRVSGPLLDRFDLVIDVPAVEVTQLQQRDPGEASAAVRRRVVAARERQRSRFATTLADCNARVRGRDFDAREAMDPDARRLLADACQRLNLSARGYDRVCRVARTVADLAGAAEIRQEHLAEAVQYRQGEDRA